MSATVTLSACPLCASQSLCPLTVPRRWIGEEVFGRLRGQLGLACCRQCGLRFVNPRPAAELLDRFYSGDTYDCHMESSDVADRSVSYILDFLAPYPGRLLDYGAGAGKFLAVACAAGREAVGFEPGQQGREACRRHGLRVVADLAELPPASFAAITLNHVFEHLSDHGAALDGLRRLLAPGGIVYIEVPNAGSLRARLSPPFLSGRLNLDERHRAFPIHLTYFRSGTLRRLLEKYGWQIERLTTTGMGVEELFLRSKQPKALSAAVSRLATNHRPKRHPLRRLVRSAFLSSGLGENLALLCRPK